jgi:hypothetical protein
MNRAIIASSCVVVLALGSVFAPVAVSARSMDGHFASSGRHVTPFRHHRTHRFYPYALYYYGYGYGYGYGYDYGADYVPPPQPLAAIPVTKKPAAEVRRGCESQIYKVPAFDGGEKDVTIRRC